MSLCSWIGCCPECGSKTVLTSNLPTVGDKVGYVSVGAPGSGTLVSGKSGVRPLIFQIMQRQGAVTSLFGRVGGEYKTIFEYATFGIWDWRLLLDPGSPIDYTTSAINAITVVYAEVVDYG